MMTIPVEYSSPLKKPLTASAKLTERELNTRLTKIFTKIGCLDKAQEGIRELYELLLDYPECDAKVNAFLSSAGTFFQKYIRNALAEITTCEMQKCGMIPNDSSPSSTKTNLSIQTDATATVSDNQTVPKKDPVEKSLPSPPLTPKSKTFTEKLSQETFEQTRSRLHSIFQYEKYKSGQRRSSLPNMERLTNNAERLEYVKNIIRSSNLRRPSSLCSTQSILSTNTSQTSLRNYHDGK